MIDEWGGIALIVVGVALTVWGIAHDLRHGSRG